jgi:hypothetical protein
MVFFSAHGNDDGNEGQPLQKKKIKRIVLATSYKIIVLHP